jgi:hypothetical protein
MSAGEVRFNHGAPDAKRSSTKSHQPIFGMSCYVNAVPGASKGVRYETEISVWVLLFAVLMQEGLWGFWFFCVVCVLLWVLFVCGCYCVCLDLHTSHSAYVLALARVSRLVLWNDLMVIPGLRFLGLFPLISRLGCGSRSPGILYSVIRVLLGDRLRLCVN